MFLHRQFVSPGGPEVFTISLLPKIFTTLEFSATISPTASDQALSKPAKLSFADMDGSPSRLLIASERRETIFLIQVNGVDFAPRLI